MARQRLRPFFGYYGAKWILAPSYPPPRHSRIVEPFAGSACYSLLYPDRQVVLVERYAVVAGIWRYLIAVSAEEILALPDLREGQTVAELPVCQEARWLIGFWLGKGKQRPMHRPGAWMREGRWKGFWGPAARRRIASQLPAIRHWRIIEGDYRTAAQGPATYFVDPPYVVGGHRYAHRLTKGEHKALARWCRSLPGQIIVCEAAGADWLPFRPLRAVRSVASLGKVGRSHEVLYHRDDLPVQPSLFGEAA